MKSLTLNSKEHYYVLTTLCGKYTRNNIVYHLAAMLAMSLWFGVWSAVNRKGWHSPIPSWAALPDNEEVLHRRRAALEGMFAYCHPPGLIRCIIYLANSYGWLESTVVATRTKTGITWVQIWEELHWSSSVQFQLMVHCCNQDRFSFLSLLCLMSLSYSLLWQFCGVWESVGKQIEKSKGRRSYKMHLQDL